MEVWATTEPGKWNRSRASPGYSPGLGRTKPEVAGTEGTVPLALRKDRIEVAMATGVGRTTETALDSSGKILGEWASIIIAPCARPAEASMSAASRVNRGFILGVDLVWHVSGFR